MFHIITSMAYVIVYLRRISPGETRVPGSPFGQRLRVLSSHPESLCIIRGRIIFGTTPKRNRESRSRTQNILRLALNSILIFVQSMIEWISSFATAPHRLLIFLLIGVSKNMKTMTAAFWAITNGLTIIRSDLCRHRIFYS